MDIYNADMEYLLDWRADREPSCEDDMVFCRVIGWKEDDEAVEAREGVCSMTDMSRRAKADLERAIFADLITKHHDPQANLGIY